MSDLSPAVKAMTLAHLDASTNLTDWVPPSSIFPMKVSPTPSYPFLRYEFSYFDAYETSCGEGVSGTVRIHVFALGENSVQAISAAVVEALENIEGFQSFDWTNTQIIPDEEVDIWHSIVDFSVVHTA